MRKKEVMMTALLVVVAAVMCSRMAATVLPADEVLPTAPDYGDASQWYEKDRGAGADIFYILSTETSDYPWHDGRTVHYADTYADSLRQPMTDEIEGVDRLVSGPLNYYAPYYRQCSLQSFTSDSLVSLRMAVPTDDVRRAFGYYLQHQNGGRPFILAGYSQGAMIALQLLREMDDETYGRMVAAYIIGANITQEMLEECPRIRPAQGADDTGVTVCYNSVRDVDCALWHNSAVVINPVNWRTDGEAATLVTEPSPLIALDRQQKDTLTVRADTRAGVVLVDGYRGTDYVLPLVGREGNYHSREIWLYRAQLRQNMLQRAAAFSSRVMHTRRESSQ